MCHGSGHSPSALDGGLAPEQTRQFLVLRQATRPSRILREDPQPSGTRSPILERAPARRNWHVTCFVHGCWVTVDASPRVGRAGPTTYTMHSARPEELKSHMSSRGAEAKAKERGGDFRLSPGSPSETDGAHAFHPNVAAAFIKLARQRKTGAFLCESNAAKRLLFLQDGELVGCRSDLPGERFGQFLLEHSFLTEPQLASAVSHIRSGKKLGEIMVELSYFGHEELSGYVRMQVRNVASALLRVEPTRIGFTSTIDVAAVTDRPVSVVEVFLHAATELPSIESFRHRFESSRGTVTRTRDEVPWYGRLAPEEAEVWDVVDGRRSLQEICISSGLPEEMVIRTLVGFCESRELEVTVLPDVEPGVSTTGTETIPDFDFFEEKDLVSAREPEPEKESRGDTVASPMSPTELDVEPDSGGRTGQEAPKPSTSAGAVARTYLDELSRQREIVLRGNHWDTLGLPSGAPKSAVLSAFHDLCSRFHPDVNLELVGSSHAADVNFVFARIYEAFRVLSEEDSARSYKELIDKEAAYEQKRTEWSAQPIEAKSRPKDPQRASQLFAMAGEAYRGKDYWRTIQLCRMAVDFGGNDAECYYLLGTALSQNPRWRLDAEEHLKIASKLEPWNTKYLVSLGELYRSEGLQHRAERVFLTAQILDPEVAIPDEDWQRHRPTSETNPDGA